MAYLVGDVELRRKLASLKNKDVKAALRKGTRAGCKIIAERAKQLAPVRTGALRAGIKVRALPRSRKWTGTQDILQQYYGAFQEFGTKKTPAKHYMEQAANEMKTQAFAAALDAVREAVNHVS